jgi:hypothetical protein
MGLTVKTAAWAVRKQKGHLAVSQGAMMHFICVKIRPKLWPPGNAQPLPSFLGFLLALNNAQPLPSFLGFLLALNNAQPLPSFLGFLLQLDNAQPLPSLDNAQGPISLSPSPTVFNISGQQ